MKIISNILELGVEQNLFNIKNIDITADTIITTLKGLEYSWSKKEKDLKSDETIEGLLDLMFNGICKITD